MDTSDYLEKELARLLGWIQSADTRISLVLPLATAMLGALAVLAPAIGKWQFFCLLMTIIASLLLILSLGCLAFASFPRVSGPDKSMIFFSGISDRSVESYRNAVKKLDENGYIDDLIDQCHINAQIAHLKFQWVKRSLMFLFTSSIPWFVSIYILYGMK